MGSGPLLRADEGALVTVEADLERVAGVADPPLAMTDPLGLHRFQPLSATFRSLPPPIDSKIRTFMEAFVL